MRIQWIGISKKGTRLATISITTIGFPHIRPFHLEIPGISGHKHTALLAHLIQ